MTSRARGALKKVALAAGSVALVSACLIPQPAYGIPCTSPQVDGGTSGCPGECTTLSPDGGDRRKDPGDQECFVDGGVP